MDRSIAHRKPVRIGVMVPSVNTVIEEEFVAALPPNVSMHVTRIPYLGNGRDRLGEMNSHAASAAKLLGDARVDLIVYGCTIGSMVGGREWDRQLMQTCEDASGIATITTGLAVAEGIHTVRAKSVALITPYDDNANRSICDYLADWGIEVDRVSKMEVPRPLGAVAESTIRALVRDLGAASADCVFVSCTDIRTLGILRSLAHELGKPVLSSNSATVWAALNRVGYDVALLSIDSHLSEPRRIGVTVEERGGGRP